MLYILYYINNCILVQNCVDGRIRGIQLQYIIDLIFQWDDYTCVHEYQNIVKTLKTLKTDYLSHIGHLDGVRVPRAYVGIALLCS